MEAEARYELAKPLPAAELGDADEATLLTAARFKASHRVSLADAVIAAVAYRQGARLLHKDPEYAARAGEGFSPGRVALATSHRPAA